MYCKKCGKMIADDSKFCSYCGTEQQAISKKMTKSKKVGLTFYLIWFALNSILWAYVPLDVYCKDYFWPLNSEYIEYYDFSEFVVYVFLLPLLILGIIILYKEISQSIKKYFSHRK